MSFLLEFLWFLLEFFIHLWTTMWDADERLHGRRRSPWPSFITSVAVVLLLVVVVLEALGKAPW